MRFLFVILAGIFHLALSSHIFACQTTPQPATPTIPIKSFVGKWVSSYGIIEFRLDDNKLVGTFGEDGELEGILVNNRLETRYSDLVDAGEAVFKLSDDGKSFSGKYREDGESSWDSWDGEKLVEDELNFEGLWETNWGTLRLAPHGDEIKGTYVYHNMEGTLTGQLKGDRLVFRYVEPNVEGIGWFEMAGEKSRLKGQFRADNSEEWVHWRGRRKVSDPNKIWLVVVEADWERNLAEQEYAFADMLESYFKMSMARHVEFRKRNFRDVEDLQAFCKQIKYIEGPVYLVISSHGDADGVAVGNRTISAEQMAHSLENTANLKMLHLSGCGMMSGDYAQKIHELLASDATFPITGYLQTVPWDASAIGDFTFLSLALIRRINPQKAVKQAIEMSPFMGNERKRGSAYPPLGLTIVNPPAKQRPEKKTARNSKPSPTSSTKEQK